MAGKAISVVVLVCPQCGKKYKGDASKPDARYQCPADQSTLIRLDTDVVTAVKQAKAENRQEQEAKAASPQASAPPPDSAAAFSAAASASPSGSGVAPIPEFPPSGAMAGFSTPYSTPGDIHPGNGAPPSDYGHETSYMPPP